MDKTTKALIDIIDAWERLKGDRFYRASDVQEWLVDDMKPVIDAGRRVLGRPTERN